MPAGPVWGAACGAGPTAPRTQGPWWRWRLRESPTSESGGVPGDSRSPRPVRPRRPGVWRALDPAGSSRPGCPSAGASGARGSTSSQGSEEVVTALRFPREGTGASAWVAALRAGDRPTVRGASFGEDLGLIVNWLELLGFSFPIGKPASGPSRCSRGSEVVFGK